MKYQFIDEVVAFEPGTTARLEVAKRFPPDDDALSGPLGTDRVPSSLILELMATTGGHLIVRCLTRPRLPLLLVVRDCTFAAPARPAVTLRAIAWLEVAGVDAPADAMVELRAEVHDGDRPIAAARLRYLCVALPEDHPARALVRM